MKKTLPILVLAMLAICDCQSQVSRVSIDRFWKWFQTNQERIRGFESHPDKILAEVADSAKKIQKGIAFEFEPPVNAVVTVTVSADGDRVLFPIVRAIVQKAPKIAGWNFVAFRQRFSNDKLKSLSLKAGDIELDINKMKFYPIISGDTLDIIIFMNGVTEENYNRIAYGSLLMVDNILGEYDCVTKVHSYDFQNMPVKVDDLLELKPLIDLAAYVDNFHKTKKH